MDLIRAQSSYALSAIRGLFRAAAGGRPVVGHPFASWPAIQAFG